MHKTVCTILLALFLALSASFYAAGVALAVDDVPMPVGECPRGFEPMDVMEHDEMEHMHAGLKADLNGNGTICMKAVTDHIHVHVDDVVR
jgi:hypothetical protein